MVRTEELSLYSETSFEARAPDGFPVSCPTLDLSATWIPETRGLFIYRPPDQVVSKISQITSPGRKAPEVCAVTWKPDGQFLALGWSDGVVRLMGLENNKAAHSITVSEDSNAVITHIAWSTSVITDTSRSRLPSQLQGQLSDDWAAEKDKALLNLPQELTFLEVETALPRISPLPASSAGSGEDATVFTIRSGIDFLFQTAKRDTYDQVNIMIVGTSDGRLRLSIYDSFVIGCFPYKRKEPDEIRLVPMDMPFISSSSINLSLLSSKVTTFQTLLRYLKQTSLHMAVEWKNAKELPARFIKAVQADLEAMDTGPNGIVPALFHTLLTGHAHAPLREWLIDSLAERGHKRWDKAVVSGLEGLRSLVHQNFLPALERCAIILSRLSGLARFYDDRDDVGFTLADINRALDIISGLTVVGHRILVLTMDELQHFKAFSMWLRFQIDRLASSSSAKDELTEKEATMDNAKVLAYIERYLTCSPLDSFFGELAQEDTTSATDLLDGGTSGLLDHLDKQFRDKEGVSIKVLPHPQFLVNYAASWSNQIFSNIAEAKRKGVRFGDPITLSIGRPISKAGVLFTALASQSQPSKVHVFRSDISVADGISEPQPLTTCIIDLKTRSITDLKFLDESTLILLCVDSAGNTIIVSVPIAHKDLSYRPYDPSGPASRPVRMEVREKSDKRGEIPARVILLGKDGTTLSSFTFPVQDS
ncbi:Anaphase-promoting complex subunit 4 [Escovopsis weberi]|uniref:Anaphase-promoting complex subunit 4 n=1 Tax=Escovopsis weberi TaxID=150374 RepID=A0A0M8MU78_ESCWE|nr:Anaphase-promoting complex subunit 4 [Escovopsis weberi]